jgi:hypothetical protein
MKIEDLKLNICGPPAANRFNFTDGILHINTGLPIPSIKAVGLFLPLKLPLFDNQSFQLQLKDHQNQLYVGVIRASNIES